MEKEPWKDILGGPLEDGFAAVTESTKKLLAPHGGGAPQGQGGRFIKMHGGGLGRQPLLDNGKRGFSSVYGNRTPSGRY